MVFHKHWPVLKDLVIYRDYWIPLSICLKKRKLIGSGNMYPSLVKHPVIRSKNKGKYSHRGEYITKEKSFQFLDTIIKLAP